MEEIIIHYVHILRLCIEIIGALFVGIGCFLALYQYVVIVWKKKERNFLTVRLTLARYLLLALEFQLGADILTTAIAPTWDEIGKLAAIAIIRTVLNYFLSKEMKEEETEAIGEE